MILNHIRDMRSRWGRAALMLLTLAGAAVFNLAGCTVKTATVPAVAVDDTIAPDAIVVPGNHASVHTGIDVVAGQPLRIVCNGRVVIGKMQNGPGDAQPEVGPQGTFFY